MNNTVLDLPLDVQLTSILALQIDGYGMRGACNILKHIQDPYIVSRACSVMLSIGISEWVRSMRPQGDPPDPTTLDIKMRDGTEICLERHVMTEGGTLKSMRSIAQQEILERAEWFGRLGDMGKLFIVEPE
ncbi:MAG: hypothetical protein IMZ43_12305 [Thermoplasmata archaeon]|nr:hypothetical protein [Thermoplasmata archaeon]